MNINFPPASKLQKNKDAWLLRNEWISEIPVKRLIRFCIINTQSPAPESQKEKRRLSCGIVLEIHIRFGLREKPDWILLGTLGV